MAEKDIVSREDLFGRNAVRWIAKHLDIPEENLFVQWVLRNNVAGFKAMVKHRGTDNFYEVTYFGDGRGYDVVVYKETGGFHGG